MNLDYSLTRYLSDLGRQTANKVREFTEGSDLAVYEGLQDADNDSRLMKKYEIAIGAVRVWVKAILACEVSEGRGVHATSAKLFLPDRYLETSINTLEASNVFEPFIPATCRSSNKSMLHTPIGEIDQFTYGLVVELSDNPVKVLYQYFQKLVHQIRDILSSRYGGCSQWCNIGLLEQSNIRDVLGVASYCTLWSNLDDLFVNDFFTSNKSDFYRDITDIFDGSHFDSSSTFFDDDSSGDSQSDIFANSQPDQQGMPDTFGSTHFGSDSQSAKDAVNEDDWDFESYEDDAEVKSDLVSYQNEVNELLKGGY